MKSKYIIIIGFVGVFLVIIGALLKIIHFIFGLINGNLLILIGMILELLTFILFIRKALPEKKTTNHENK